jgi:hypothetical protein
VNGLAPRGSTALLSPISCGFLMVPVEVVARREELVALR